MKERYSRRRKKKLNRRSLRISSQTGRFSNSHKMLKSNKKRTMHTSYCQVGRLRIHLLKPWVYPIIRILLKVLTAAYSAI